MWTRSCCMVCCVLHKNIIFLPLCMCVCCSWLSDYIFHLLGNTHATFRAQINECRVTVKSRMATKQTNQPNNQRLGKKDCKWNKRTETTFACLQFYFSNVKIVSHINANTVEDIKNSSDEFLNVEFMHKMQNKTQITTLSIYVVWQPNAAQVK